MPTAPARDAARGGAALLVVDMLNDLDFPDSGAMRADAERAARAIVRLKSEAVEAGLPVIYVNDNFGQWHSERSRLIDHVLRDDSPGRTISRTLLPDPCDYFVIKPQFSGFYATNLPVLLPKLGVDRLILTGLAADICVLFTAADAHMRDYGLWVPEDAVAGSSPERTGWALDIMRQSMAAETRATDALPLAEWLAGDRTE